jgi:hypothetical protein
MPGWLVTALVTLAVVLLDRNRRSIRWWASWTYHKVRGHHRA